MKSLERGLISSIPIFAHLSDAVIQQVADISHVITVDEGQFVYNRGETPTCLFILLKGQVAQLLVGPSRTEAILEIFEPVDYFVLSAIFSQGTYLTSAKALRKSQLICISAPKLKEIAAKDSGLMLGMLGSMSRQYREAIVQLEDLKLRRVADRLARYLAILYERQPCSPMKLPYSKGILAARLGVAREHLSRAFSALRPLGILTSGAKVYVKDPDALRAYAMQQAYQSPAVPDAGLLKRADFDALERVA
jgi:CRP/FNR family transcriptional activator FtrB